MTLAGGECLIRDVKFRGSRLGPVLVNFEHAMLKPDDSARLQCGVFTSTDHPKICTVAATAEEGDVVYQGNVHQDSGELCSTFLAVRNKRNNKMRLFEACSVRLSPTVASDFIGSFNAQNKMEANFNLSHAFGSKKSKRVADQRARMEVNVESVKDKLSATVNDISIQEENLPAADDHFLKLLPPCHREASTPGDVYPISDILKEKEIRSLEKFYLKSVVSKELDTSNFSPLYKHMITTAAAKSSQYGALLLYAESLIQFCNVQKFNHKINLCPFSDKVHKKIMKEFVSVDGNLLSRSQVMFDKAVILIIVLCLHIGSFSTDLNIIASSIRHLDTNRVRMLARLIGTMPSRNPGVPKTLVSLRVPLPPVQSLILKTRKSRK